MKILKSIAWIVLLFGITLGTYFYKVYHLPPHYRTTDMTPSPYQYLKGYLHGHTTFNREGLHKLHSIASGYLDFHQFDQLLKSTPRSLVVLNGLASDVTYLKNKNLKFFCLEHKNGQIRSINRGPAKNLVCRARQIAAGILSPWNDETRVIERESLLLASRNVQYLNPFPADWLSEWSFMENMIDFFDSVERNQTLYFHCGHGQGRTTTMLALWDIYNNANQVSIEDIFSRQFLLGGEDLTDVEEWKDGTWPAEHLIARRNLVLAFYKYMTDKGGYGNLTWSQWLNNSHLGPGNMDIHAYI